MAHEILDPPEILHLDASQVDELLDRLEATVPVEDGLVRMGGDLASEATVFGDSHGDWKSTVSATAPFLEDPAHRALIGLGDYVDRAPGDCEEGSVANSLYLLQLAGAFPGRVHLIVGNHETSTRIPVFPHDLPEEVDQLWGPEERRYQRIVLLLNRGPLALITSSGAYLAHGGFPRERGSGALEGEFRTLSEDRLMEIVWGECRLSRTHRGVVVPFDGPELARFLDRSGTKVFLRGHDPDLVGRPLFDGRCLTLHTCRLYQRFGGVIAARLPLDRPVRSVSELEISHLETERSPDPSLGDGPP